MPTTRTRPTYAAAFRCIGATCEDTCCRDWDIPVDKATYEKYQQFPERKLGTLVSQFVSVESLTAPEGLYALIHRTPSGLCPFWGADQLCSIQKEYGPELLSATCSVYPRSLSRVDGELEGSLSLSCPEAARNVLLDPAFMNTAADLSAGGFRIDNVFHLAHKERTAGSSPNSFFAIRAILIDLVRDRSRPMWQRLLLIGVICERLNAMTAFDDNVAPALSALLNDRKMAAELEDLPRNPKLKLEIVFDLTNARINDKTCGNRFRDTFWTFVEGIGTPAGSEPVDDMERLRQAEQDYYRPFFERYPFILENYLVNYIFQNLFPWGREGSDNFTQRSIFDEYLLMATQFAWINTLLIGIAGHYKEDFAGEHVVQTIQPLTRAVEHYPHTLNSIVELIKLRKLDHINGMAIMLKT